MSLGFLGSNGLYWGPSDAANQMAASQNLLAKNQVYGATQYGNVSGGLLNQMYATSTLPIAGLWDPITKGPPEPEKKKRSNPTRDDPFDRFTPGERLYRRRFKVDDCSPMRMVDRLRLEIEKWHDDVLGRTLTPELA